MKKGDKKRQSATLLAKDKKLIMSVVSSPTVTAGCKKVGMSTDAFYDRMRTSPAFKSEFEKQINELVDFARSEMKSVMGEGVRVVRKLLRNRSAAIRLKAAGMIIAHGEKIFQDETILKQLAELEEKFGTGR